MDAPPTPPKLPPDPPDPEAPTPVPAVELANASMDAVDIRVRFPATRSVGYEHPEVLIKINFELMIMFRTSVVVPGARKQGELIVASVKLLLVITHGLCASAAARQSANSHATQPTIFKLR